MVNVTGVVTLNKSDLDEQEMTTELPDYLMADVDHGLRQILGL